MQDFVCPQCGHKSTFDPWQESAHCPNCGYQPSERAFLRKRVFIKQRAPHQPFLDELLAHWEGRHTPDEVIGVPTSDVTTAWFRIYQRAMGEDPDLRPGRRPGYVRTYHPQPDEMESFVRAYLWLRRGERASAARQFQELTVQCPGFVEPWIWLTATTNDATEREAWLEKAVILEPAHPLAQDALAIVKGRVSLKEEERRSDVGQRLMIANCPQCAGPMHYEAGAAEVECEYCGNRLHLPRSNLLEEKASLLSDLRLRRRHQGHIWADIKRIVHCQACGAQLTMTQDLMRTCLYCGSTNVIVEDSKRSFEKPDGFLPFEIDEREAQDAISRAQRSGLRRLTFRFTGKERQVGELEDVYLPFWVFDGYVEVHTWSEEALAASSSDQKDLGTDTMMFTNLLFPSVDTPPMHLLEKVFPFDLKAMVPYEPRLVADRRVALYSLDVEVMAQRACDAMIEMAREKSGRLVGPIPVTIVSGDSASDAPIRLRRSFQVSGASYQLVLLPLWVAQLRSEKRYSLAVVNGQTGEVAFGRAVAHDER
jgi:DNA-directed RNA polymerase subunit RPC12/RpoP